jgi:hypothetical protein
MKKIVALLTALAFALSVGVVFAAEPASKTTTTAPAKKAEKKKPAKKKAAKKEMKSAPTGTAKK